MNDRKRYLKCVEWLMKEWLEEEGVSYTTQLSDKAHKTVKYITKYGKDLYITED